MKDTLIIGSKGYIGSALYNKLKNRSIGVDLHEADLSTDYGKLTKKEVSKYRNVILLAASSGVKPCLGHMKYSFKNNVSNFVSLLGKLNKKQKFIYASTGSIYGDINGYCATEDFHLSEAVSYYDLTKKINDMYAMVSDVEYYGLRFGTVNGKTDSSQIVRDDLIINAMVKHAITNKKIMSINPEVSRGILGLNDLCNAISTIVDSNKDNRGIYNIASFNTSVQDITNYIVDRFNCECETRKDIKNNLYDFRLNTDKFCNTYNFIFEESIESITNDLVKDFEKIEFIRRDVCLKI